MTKPPFHAVILAGGRGTRFWPRSRKKTPKQLLPFDGSRSLLQQTVARLAPLIPPERIWILTNDILASAIRRQLPDVPRHQVIAEPVQRNTAPAIALAARLILEQDPSAVMGVFPSDHLIAKPSLFSKRSPAPSAPPKTTRSLCWVWSPAGPRRATAISSSPRGPS